MNNESPQSNDPGPRGNPFSKIFWLLGALTPAALIMLFEGHHHLDRGGVELEKFVALGLNPAMTVISCYCLLNRPDRSKVIPIMGGIFLGAVFAVFNIVIGAFAGCVLGGGHSFL